MKKPTPTRPLAPCAALQQIHDRFAWLDARIPKPGHRGYEEERDRLAAMADSFAALIDATEQLIRDSVECDDADETIPARGIVKTGRFVHQETWDRFVAVASPGRQARRKRRSDHYCNRGLCS